MNRNEVSFKERELDREMQQFKKLSIVSVTIFLFTLLIWLTSNIYMDEALAIDSDLVQSLTPPDFEDSIRDMPDYTEVRDSTLDMRLQQIPSDHRELVSAFQELELMQILYDSVMAYKHGDYEMILAHRLRADYKIWPDATRWQKSVLKRFVLEENEQMPEDPEQIMRLLVKRNFYGDHGSGYKGLYTELSVLGSRIEYHQSKSMPTAMGMVIEEINKRRFYRLRNGMVVFSPSIEYVNSPEKVLKEEGELQYADVWLAAADRHGHKFPRFRRYYWSPNDNTWLQMEMVSFYARKRRADPFF